MATNSAERRKEGKAASPAKKKLGQFKKQNEILNALNKDFGFVNPNVHSGQYIDTAIIDQQLEKQSDFKMNHYSGSPLSKHSHNSPR